VKLADVARATGHFETACQLLSKLVDERRKTLKDGPANSLLEIDQIEALRDLAKMTSPNNEATPIRGEVFKRLSQLAARNSLTTLQRK
jgi:hypothetical protein